MSPTQKLPLRNVNLFTLFIMVSALTWLPTPVFAETGDYYKGSDGVGSRDMGPSSGGSSGGGSSTPYYGPNLWRGLRSLRDSLQNKGNESQTSPAEQARQQRLREAHTANERGNAFFEKGDWANAVACYQEAVNKNPDDTMIRQNLARAQSGLQRQRAAEEQERSAERATAERKRLAKRAAAERERLAKQQDKAAAANMKQSLNIFAESLTAAPATSGGLDFMAGSTTPASDPSLKDAVNDNQPGQQKPHQAKASDQAASPDAFGTKKSNPTLEFSDPNAGRVGSDTKAVDQLTSMTQNNKSLPGATSEGAAGKGELGFDTGNRKNGSLSDVKVETPESAEQMPNITPAMLKNPAIQEAVLHYNKWNPQLQKAREEVKQAQAAVENAKDRDDKAVANAVLISAKSKSDGLQVAVKSAIKEATIHIEKFAVSDPTPAGQSQPATTPPAN